MRVIQPISLSIGSQRYYSEWDCHVNLMLVQFTYHDII
jgi:hypothetical protein